MTDATASCDGIVYSVVVDTAPALRRQAVAWAWCGLRLAGLDPRLLQVNVMPGVPGAFMAGMARWGVQCQELAPDARLTGPMNKVRQTSGVLPEAATTVLCDCDTVFVTALPERARDGEVAAKLVDFGNPALPYWVGLLDRFGLPAPGVGEQAVRTGRTTYRNNVNGGLYLIGESVRAELFTAWREYAHYLVAHVEHLGPWRIHADQIAFGLACARVQFPVRLLDERLNYPMHLPAPSAVLADPPVVLHHHQSLGSGRLEYGPYHGASAHAAVRASVDRVNAVLAEVRWEEFEP
jgi:hypothetical protein